MIEGKNSAVFQFTIVTFILVATLLSGCQPPATPAATLPPPDVTVVINPDITDVFAGDTVALAVETSGQNLRFKWSASKGKLSDFDTPAAFYIAPDTPGVDTVTVEVSSASGTTVEHVSFNIVVSPTSAPSPTSPSPPTITITAPLTEAVCPLGNACTFDVEGIYSGSTPSPDLEVVIFVRDAGQWWPHKTGVVESDGSWQGSAQIGDRTCWSAGYRFGIMAMAMTRDQVDALLTGFQPLPQDYVARSHSVDLVTTYAPVPIDLSLASGSVGSGSIITMTAVGESHLSFDYHLGPEGWVEVAVPVHLDMTCMKKVGFSIAFSLEGTWGGNTLEVKLEDADNTNYGWRKHRESVTDGTETVEVSLDRLELWWDEDGQDTDMDWQQVVNMLFAGSQHAGDEDGEGQVIIRDLALSPPITF